MTIQTHNTTRRVRRARAAQSCVSGWIHHHRRSDVAIRGCDEATVGLLDGVFLRSTRRPASTVRRHPHIIIAARPRTRRRNPLSIRPSVMHVLGVRPLITNYVQMRKSSTHTDTHSSALSSQVTTWYGCMYGCMYSEHYQFVRALWQYRYSLVSRTRVHSNYWIHSIHAGRYMPVPKPLS